MWTLFFCLWGEEGLCWSNSVPFKTHQFSLSHSLSLGNINSWKSNSKLTRLGQTPRQFLRWWHWCHFSHTRSGKLYQACDLTPESSFKNSLGQQLGHTSALGKGKHSLLWLHPSSLKLERILCFDPSASVPLMKRRNPESGVVAWSKGFSKISPLLLPRCGF